MTNSLQEEECNRAEAHAEYKHALSDFDSAINLNLEYETAWNYRGLVLASIDRHPEAIASYDKALQIYKSKEQIEEGAFTWYNRGLSYAALGSHEEAIASYKQSDLEFNGSNLDLLYNLALSLQHLKRYKEAVITFNKVIKISQKEKKVDNRRCDSSWISLIEILVEKADECVRHQNIVSAVEQFNLVADRIEALMRSNVSDGLRHSLREHMYKSSYGILKLISSDEHIRQRFLKLGEKSFMLLSQDRDYRARLEAEGDYQELSRHWIYLAKA